jgi:tRNA threonylcarbamoyladenosine biosynthesis protein TsaB
VVQGAAFAAELPVVGVSTLAALAQGCARETGARRILCALDARMGELYWGAYALRPDGLVERSGDEQVAPAGQAALPEGRGWHGIGSGWAAFGDTLATRMGPALEATDPDRLCHAWDVAVLAAAGYTSGQCVPAAEALPVYLRNRVATPKA